MGLSKRRKITRTVAIAAFVVIMVSNLSAVVASAATATWTTQADFEMNFSTTVIPTPTIPTFVETSSHPGDVVIGLPDDYVVTANITSVSVGSRVYTAGIERPEITVIDGDTNTIVKTLQLPARAAGMVYNSASGKIYVGQVNQSNVVVINVDQNDAISTITVGNGAYASLYKPGPDNSVGKVYIANTRDHTVTILNGDDDSVVKLVPVAAGSSTAYYNSDKNKIYFTNSNNTYVTVIDSESNEVVKSVVIAPHMSLLSGLRLDAAANGFAAAAPLVLSWNHDPLLGEEQQIEFQIRTAADAASLETGKYLGPGPVETAETAWYKASMAGATTVTGPEEGTQTTSVSIDAPSAAFVELRVKLSSDGLASPVLHAVSLSEALPDLVATNVEGTVVDTRATVTATIMNIGTGSAPATSSKISIVGPVELQVGDLPCAPLASSASCTGQINVPDVPPGDYSWKVCADKPNLVNESNEENNCYQSPATFRVSRPDIVVEILDVKVENGYIKANVKIKNIGNAPTTRGFSLLSYLSTDQIIDQVIPTDDTSYGYFAVSGIMPVGYEWVTTITVDLGWQGKTVPSGNYYYGVAIDPQSLLVNEYKGNNTPTSSDTVYYNNDMVITDLTCEIIGGELYYYYSVTNLGNAYAQFSVGRYLSVDNIILPTSDRFLNTGTVALRGGETKGPLSVPPTTMKTYTAGRSGTWYCGAFADVNNTIKESNEDNNTAVGGPITIP